MSRTMPSAIHWLEQRTGDVPGNSSWLGPSERAVLSELRFLKRRTDWRLGRWTAKLLTRGWLQRQGEAAALQEIEIRAAADGAPEVWRRNERLCAGLSISHSHGIGFCALAAEAPGLGCDIEKIAARPDRFVADYFTSPERELVARGAAGVRNLTATLIWSAKESVLKALRCGLRCDTRAVRISLADLSESGEWQPITAAVESQARRFQGWWRVDGGFVRTLFISARRDQAVGQPAEMRL